MSAAKRATTKQSRARKIVKAAGFALFLVAGAPASGDFRQATTSVQASALHLVSEKYGGWWIFKGCKGTCPGHGMCCGFSVT